MASVNKWIGIGNLGKDPEVRYSPDGKAFANISIGCNEVWKDKDGNKQEKVEWVRVCFFGRLAEIVAEYLKKGAQVYIEGRLQTRKYEKDGQERYVTEVIASEMKMLGSRGGAAAEMSDKESSSPPVSQGATVKAGAGFDNFEDDIPF